MADRDGIRESEQIRRAIDAWLRSKGVGVPERSTIRGGKARRAGRGRKLIRGA